MSYREIKPLGDLCDILDSKREPVTKKDRVAGEYPYYGATGILDYVDYYIFDEPLVLVGEDGAKWGAGENTAFAVAGKCWINNHAHVIRPHRDTVLDKWIIYYLNATDLSPFITGLTVPKLNQAKLRDIPIPLPPLRDQKRIVAILDETLASIDAAIANVEKNIENVHELLNRFVESRIFNDGFVKAYPTETVSEVANPRKGSIRTGPFGSQLLHGEFVDAGIAVLGIDNAVENEFRWGKRRYITPEKYASLTRYRVYPGDVIITIMGTCGRCAVVPNDVPLAINTKHLVCISLDRRRCDPEFLHKYFLFSPMARTYLADRASGSIMAGLNMGIVRDLPVVLPSIAEQKALSAKIALAQSETTELIRVYRAKVAALTDLKQSILHRAFADELTATPDGVLEAAAA